MFLSFYADVGEDGREEMAMPGSKERSFPAEHPALFGQRFPFFISATAKSAALAVSAM